MLNKKALSPLIATILLVVFALIVGTATMNWGKSYVEEVPEQNVESSFGTSIVISIDSLDNPLKKLQIMYIADKLTLEEYLLEEEIAITKLRIQENR